VISYSVLARDSGSQIWYASPDLRFSQCIGYITVLMADTQAPEDLFETISQALLSAVDRDALSGWGAHVYIIEKDKVTKRLLKGRQD